MHNVGISGMDIATNEIGAVGLGSCVAIIMWSDRMHKVALAHTFLPHQNCQQDILCCADRSIPKMLAQFPGQNMYAALVGGASMFTSNHKFIGQNNILAARAGLVSSGVKIVCEDVGGKKGRTVRVSLNKSKLMIDVKTFTGSYTLYRSS